MVEIANPELTKRILEMFHANGSISPSEGFELKLEYDATVTACDKCDRTDSIVYCNKGGFDFCSECHFEWYSHSCTETTTHNGRPVTYDLHKKT